MFGGETPSSPANVALRLGLPPGRVLVYRVVERQSFTNEKSKGAVLSLADYTVRQQVQSVSDDDVLVECRIDRFEWTLSAGSEQVHFDSSLPEPEKERPEFQWLRGAVGRPFSVTMDARGRVHEIHGSAEPAVGNDPAIARARELLGIQRLKSLLVRQYAWLPDELPAPGQAWKRREEAPLPLLTLVRENSLRLTRVDGAECLLEGQIELSSRPADGIVTAAGVARAEVVASAPGTARIRFNQQLGVLESLDAEISFTMRVSTTPSARRAKPEVAAQSIVARSTYQLLSLDGQPRGK